MSVFEYLETRNPAIAIYQILAGLVFLKNAGRDEIVALKESASFSQTSLSSPNLFTTAKIQTSWI